MRRVRPRLVVRRPGLARLGDVLVGLLALALLWYGLMTVLLAAKVAPGTVDDISGYRTAIDWLTGSGLRDLAGDRRGLLAAIGVVAFLVFGWAAWRSLPRARLARHPLTLAEDEHGRATLAPRAVERLAETATSRLSGVSRAAARLGEDELAVELAVTRPRDVADVLRRARSTTREELERHGLPVVDVPVTLAAFDANHQRELL